MADQVKWKTTQVTIQAGSAFEVPVEVDEGSTVSWGFQTDSGDIGFSVLFTEDGAPEESLSEVIPKDRFNSDANLIQGSLNVVSKGTLYLQWDNTYSWFSAKQLLYSITLDEAARTGSEEPLPPPPLPKPPLDEEVGSPPENADEPKPVANDGPVPQVVFVLGGPGAGKGTQCEMLAKDYGFVHLSAGDLLRAERNDPNSKDGELISSYIKEGKIVPIAITVKLLMKAMGASDASHFLIDGFPRNQDNVQGWEQEVGPNANVVGVFFFDCDEQTMEKRLLERGKTSGRSDDNVDSIRKRFTTYMNESLPIIKYFEQQEKVWTINTNQTIEQVNADVCAVVEEKMGMGKLATPVSEVAETPSQEEPLPPTNSDPAPTTQEEVAPVAETPTPPAVVEPTNKASLDIVAVAPANRKMPPRVILGTMTFGNPVADADALTMLEMLVTADATNAHTTGNGKIEIDTASMYGKGKVEKIIGKLLEDARATQHGLREKLFIATKANPFKGFHNTLRPDSVLSQLKTSLKSMGTDSVGLFYLHSPDMYTPIEATLEACQTLYERGKFRELGLSNYPAWQVVQIYHICKSRGWVVPTVYQGMYNAITRAVEPELFRALRACNMRFYAYNPLAGGLLTGRYTNIEDIPTKGRFSKGTMQGKMYQNRFFRPSYFDAITKVKEACESQHLTMANASIRWMMHHSLLEGGLNDGIILGASKVIHLEETLDSCSDGPLPEAVVRAFDNAWDVCKMDCPKYYREELMTR